jgi:hypothetical protein
MGHRQLPLSDKPGRALRSRQAFANGRTGEVSAHSRLAITFGANGRRSAGGTPIVGALSGS